MFIPALFPVVQMWKQSKCPSAVRRSTACGACTRWMLSWKRHANYEKPLTKNHILSSCIYMQYPERPNLYRQRVHQWLPKAGAWQKEEEEGLLRGPVQFQGQQQCSHIGCGDHCSIKPHIFTSKKENPEIKRVSSCTLALKGWIL